MYNNISFNTHIKQNLLRRDIWNDMRNSISKEEQLVLERYSIPTLFHKTYVTLIKVLKFKEFKTIYSFEFF